MEIQEKLQEIMLSRGWTYYQLAKRANLSETTVTNLFKRNNAPTFHTLLAICNACGITISQFFSDGDDPVVLTEEQKTLLAKWSTLTETKKKVLLDLLDILS